MSLAVRQMIEDAMIVGIGQALESRLNPSSGYLRLVGPYNGEIDESDGQQDFIRLIKGRMPCCLVTATSAIYNGESVARTRFAKLTSFEIYIASNHMRTREDRLRKDITAQSTDANADPGIYRIAEDVQQVVSGNDFGLAGVGYFQPLREDVLLQERGFTVWRLSYQTMLDAHVLPRDHGDQALLSYLLDGNVDPIDANDAPNPMVEAEGDLS